MTDDPVPDAVSELIAATNRGDSDGFLAAFSDDAVVRDGSRTFQGRARIAEWDSTDNIGVSMHFDLRSVTALGDDRFDVRIDATSRRFNGSGTMHITLRDGRIATLEAE